MNKSQIAYIRSLFSKALADVGATWPIGTLKIKKTGSEEDGQILDFQITLDGAKFATGWLQEWGTDGDCTLN